MRKKEGQGGNKSNTQDSHIEEPLDFSIFPRELKKTKELKEHH